MFNIKKLLRSKALYTALAEGAVVISASSEGESRYVLVNGL